MSVESLSWVDLPHRSFAVDAGLLHLGWTLASGQAFRWRAREDGWWVGVVEGCVLRVTGDDGAYTYAAYPDLPRPDFW